MTDDVVETINAILNGEDNFILLLQRPQLERIRDEIVALRRTIRLGPDLPALARADALEEAARACEGGYTTGSMRSTLKAIAAAIRALKEEH